MINARQEFDNAADALANEMISAISEYLRRFGRLAALGGEFIRTGCNLLVEHITVQTQPAALPAPTALFLPPPAAQKLPEKEEATA